MPGYDYDFFVIGAGSGGVRASRMAASHGAKVAVAEERFLGGTCVNVGCIPKKLFSYGSHYLHYGYEAAAYGWDFSKPVLDWARLIENKNIEIKRLNEIYVEHTGQKIDIIEQALERDRYMTPEDAKDFGIVDEVVTKRPESDLGNEDLGDKGG